MKKILVVDDEPPLCDTLQYNLSRKGYSVSTALDGRRALAIAIHEPFDLIILDLMLPGLDGLEVCRRLRRQSSVPVLMLTARADEVDKVVGLEVGADDYLTKPFSMRELEARVDALLRRVELVREETSGRLASEGRRLVSGDLTLDLKRHEALRSGATVALKPREFALLEFFVRNRGAVLSRDLILQHVWGWDFVGGSRTVDVHVRWLREKIEDDPGNPTRIVTVRGVGYRFEG